MHGGRLTEDGLASELAPELKRELEKQKTKILESLGPMGRWALEKCWPALMAALPAVAGAVVSWFRKRFGSLTVNDILDFLGKR